MSTTLTPPAPSPASAAPTFVHRKVSTRTLAVRSVRANKVRLLLTTFAVVLGVSFVTGSFLLTDSLRDVFKGLAADITDSSDVVVRGEVPFGDPTLGRLVPPDLVATVAAVEGVEAAEGTVTTFGATLLKADGTPFRTNGAPQLITSWTPGTTYSPFSVAEGRQPESASEMAMNVSAATQAGYAVGDEVRVLTPAGARSFTLVGTARFAGQDNALGAVNLIWEPATASDVAGFGGSFNQIDVKAAEGQSQSDVADRVRAVLPDGFEAVTQETVTDETQEQFGGFASIFGNILLTFAAVAVFVSTFIVNNTFTILVGQRVRELALLRALGAGRRQVIGMVAGEAMLVALVATAIGFLGGFGVNLAIQALFASIGADFPASGIIIAPRTVIVAIVFGFGVTLACALPAAVRASKVPPIAALGEPFALQVGNPRRRMALSGAALVIGSVLFGIGLFAKPGGTTGILTFAGLGAVLIFLGAAGVSRLFARPLANALGTPVERLAGVAGKLARQNAARTPRRTAATASALMIGLALVAAISVLTSSITASVRDVLTNGIKADLLLSDQGFTGFSPAVADVARGIPGVATVVPFRFGQFQVDGSTRDVIATDPAGLPSIFDIGVTDGSLDDLGPGTLAVAADPARDLGLTVGSEVQVLWAATGTTTLRVAAVYDQAQALGANWLVTVDELAANVPTALNDAQVGVVVEDGADVLAVQRELQAALATDAPNVDVQTRAELLESITNNLNTVLAVATALLALAVIIAMLGIANTLALSVYERIRELGLLRAVGMGRRQMRRMIRWEAGIVSMFGAIIGVVLGVIIGVVVAIALPESVVTVVSLPWGRLVVLALVVLAAGLLAALRPAYKASKLDILKAIAHD